MRILSILMSNSLCENDVKEKWKVEAVGLIFHVVSKNVVFYALGKCCTHQPLFKKPKISILEINLFSLPTSTRKNNALRLTKASTVESYLGTMEKLEVLAFSRYPQQVMLRTHPWPRHFLIFLAFFCGEGVI